MIAPLAEFIDWSVLQIGYAMLPQSMWREAANDREINERSAKIQCIETSGFA